MKMVFSELSLLLAHIAKRTDRGEEQGTRLTAASTCNQGTKTPSLSFPIEFSPEYLRSTEGCYGVDRGMMEVSFARSYVNLPPDYEVG